MTSSAGTSLATATSAGASLATTFFTGTFLTAAFSTRTSLKRAVAKLSWNCRYAGLGTFDQRQQQPVRAYAADGSLWHRHAPRRDCPAEDRRHRQPAHDHPRGRRQGAQGPRPAPEPGATVDPARWSTPSRQNESRAAPTSRPVHVDRV